MIWPAVKRASEQASGRDQYDHVSAMDPASNPVQNAEQPHSRQLVRRNIELSELKDRIACPRDQQQTELSESRRWPRAQREQLVKSRLPRSDESIAAAQKASLALNLARSEEHRSVCAKTEIPRALEGYPASIKGRIRSRPHLVPRLVVHKYPLSTNARINFCNRPAL